MLRSIACSVHMTILAAPSFNDIVADRRATARKCRDAQPLIEENDDRNLKKQVCKTNPNPAANLFV